jgi:nuclear transport factor 2 (NTF2) superfamily protein
MEEFMPAVNGSTVAKPGSRFRELGLILPKPPSPLGAYLETIFDSPKETDMTQFEQVSTRAPLPPFTHDAALLKVRLAEDAWNSRDPEKVALAYTPTSRWRNRSEFMHGRQEIVAFLTRKWAKELDYRLIKELWAFTANRIAVRFAYEWHDDSGNWFRSYGNENWEFDDDGLMRLRLASINDLPIRESERKYYWALGRRPDTHPGLSELGL